MNNQPTFLGDTLITSGPLAGFTLAQVGILVQQQGQLLQARRDPNKPRRQSDNIPDEVNNTFWAEEGAIKEGTSSDPQPDDPGKDFVVIRVKRMLSPQAGFEATIRYRPGDGLTDARLQRLGIAGQYPHNFYTFVQLFRPVVKINGRVHRGTAKDAEGAEYETSKWNVDSRDVRRSGIWEYRGAMRGGGNVEGLQPYARLVDHVKQGNRAYWEGPNGFGLAQGSVNRVDADVSFESYVLLCCSDSNVKRFAHQDSEQTNRSIRYVGVIGYYQWEYKYTWNGEDFSHTFPFNQWKWHGGRTGPGWRAIDKKVALVDANGEPLKNEQGQPLPPVDGPAETAKPVD